MKRKVRALNSSVLYLFLICQGPLLEHSLPTEKVTIYCTISEVNSIIGEVWDFMAQFDDKYWEHYHILKKLHIWPIFLYISVFMAKPWDTFSVVPIPSITKGITLIATFIVYNSLAIVYCSSFRFRTSTATILQFA